ncbi:hypothetical protein B0H16DRAFT_1751765 [Mycena metata]|uniref:F-box domain-containing protein n=1 Tax=Mycena metata TaxID=1033252 RepID=A0AAD7DJ15_9AGAR|nr:hypothetical protein B0H16DRAFT_1751765 [Mycena metata]
MSNLAIQGGRPHLVLRVWCLAYPVFAIQFIAACLWFLLPNELQLYIFDFVFAGRLKDMALRTKVCATSSAWMRFLRAHPRFWTHICITSRIPKDDVLAFITLAGALPLRFYITLNSSDPVVDMSYLAPHVLVATHFTVESDDRDTLARLQQTFAGVSGPLLRHFALFFRRARQPTPRDSTPLLPHTWFSGQHQDLRVLHLCCAVLPFVDLDFPSLRVLRIWGVHPQYSLDVHGLAKVVCNSPMLTDLTVRRFTCTGLRGVALLPEIYSATLKTLEVGFSRDGSIGRLATLFDFPSLTDLYLEISSAGHVAQTRAMRPQLLSRVTALLVRDPRTQYTPFVFMSIDFFSLFPNLQGLNLRFSRPPVFTDLVNTSSDHYRTHGTPLLPALTFLTVNEATMTELFEFASRYLVVPRDGPPYVSLRHIHAGLVPYGPFDMEEAAAVAWLSSNVREFVGEPDRLAFD